MALDRLHLRKIRRQRMATIRHEAVAKYYRDHPLLNRYAEVPVDPSMYTRVVIAPPPIPQVQDIGVIVKEGVDAVLRACGIPQEWLRPKSVTEVARKMMAAEQRDTLPTQSKLYMDMTVKPPKDLLTLTVL
jgi:hypothetical protein